eukprot:m.97181 g.97181  ORF g.97181 m.97181 type:complete len:277 (+) comp15517_c0_seq1:1166-1996(+)
MKTLASHLLRRHSPVREAAPVPLCSKLGQCLSVSRPRAPISDAVETNSSAMANNKSAQPLRLANSFEAPPPPSPPANIVVLSGPSGAGKSTVLKLLMAEFPNDFGFSVSHTTRKPRPGETDGVEYHFTTREHMQKMIAEGAFIETAEFSGNLYGTSKKAVKDVCAKGRICILDIEKKGCESVKAAGLNALFIQIRPPNLSVLEERLRARGTESDDSLRRRLEEAAESMEYGTQPGKFHHLVENHEVQVAYDEVKTALLPSIEHNRASAAHRTSAHI